MISLILYIITALAQWRYFQKMGREGWEGIIPIYSTYVLFKVLYGNGWKFLLLLIPFYNIYLYIKLNLDLAHNFNLGTGFGIGLIFLPFIFTLILAFGDAVFRDGSYSKIGGDALSQTLDKVSDKVSDSGATREELLQKLKEMDELHTNGVLTDAEYEAKRAEIVKKL